MELRLDQILIGSRIRQDYGRVADLAKSIEEVGLLHPLAITEDHRLIAGHRRLKACERLGWKSVPVHVVKGLDALGVIQAEWAENEHRKDLTDDERDRRYVDLWNAAVEAQEKAAAAETAKAGEDSGGTPAKKRGRPREPSSDRSVQEATGIDRRTVRDARERTDLRDAFPQLFNGTWNNKQIQDAGALFKDLGKRDTSRIVAILTEQPEGAPIPPRTALGMIQQFSRCQADQRKTVFDLHRSSDEAEQSYATTYLAQIAPEPDPRCSMLAKIRRELVKLAEQKDDKFSAKLARLADDVASLTDKINEEHLATLKRLIP